MALAPQLPQSFARLESTRRRKSSFTRSLLLGAVRKGGGTSMILASMMNLMVGANIVGFVIVWTGQYSHATWLAVGVVRRNPLGWSVLPS